MYGIVSGLPFMIVRRALFRLSAQSIHTSARVNAGADHHASTSTPGVPSAKEIGEKLKAESAVKKETFREWLFEDGWRRPLPKEEGGKMRADWVWFGFHPTDEYKDWKRHHLAYFGVFTVVMSGFFFFISFRPDWPDLKEWAQREAYLVIDQREKLGLPLISPHLVDPEKVTAQLPSDEELGSYEIIV